MTTTARQLVRKFQTLPLTLYRIQASLPVRLRDYDTQMAKGRFSYDLKLHLHHYDDDDHDHGGGKKMVVMPAVGDEWIGPNGMSLRPATDTMVGILQQWRGEPTIFRLNEGLKLPDHLIVLHERDDHWSLQTTVPVPLDDFNATLTELLQSAPAQTRQQFIEQLEDLNDQDN
jgi:hypothetical protein